MSWWKESVVANRSFVQSIREHLHRFPELSFEEFETQKYVSSILKELKIEHTFIAETGIVALIKADNRSEKCIALRSELDALPISEQNTHSFISEKEGIMHACGHDIHTAILLGTAKILNENKHRLSKNIKLFFQPGEEKTPGGASIMIAENCLENPKVEAIFALHVYPELTAGKIGTREGLYMASCDEIHLTIHGKGGHGAMPHQCVDPIAIGAQIVSQLQQIVSRKCDPKIPCVLSFGHFEALGATNIIPEKAHLKGTFRTMNEAWRTEALALISSQINAICESNGAKAELHIEKGYPFLENDVALTQKFTKAVEKTLGKENVEHLPIRLTSEDFSFYAQKIPACFFRLGVRNEEKGIVYGVHHPKFDVDNACFETGMNALLTACFDVE